MYTFRAKVWICSGQGAWHFVTLPAKTARELKEDYGHSRRGWGTIKVTASTGKTKWNTSVFPEKKSGSFVLPIKMEVRKAEKISAGKTIQVHLEIA